MAKLEIIKYRFKDWISEHTIRLYTVAKDDYLSGRLE